MAIKCTDVELKAWVKQTHGLTDRQTDEHTDGWQHCSMPMCLLPYRRGMHKSDSSQRIFDRYTTCSALAYAVPRRYRKPVDANGVTDGVE